MRTQSTCSRFSYQPCTVPAGGCSISRQNCEGCRSWREESARLIRVQGLTRTIQELRVFIRKSNEALSTSVSSEDVDHLIEVELVTVPVIALRSATWLPNAQKNALTNLLLALRLQLCTTIGLE